MQEETRVQVAVVSEQAAECLGLATALAQGGYHLALQVPEGEDLLDALANGLEVRLVLLDVSATMANGFTTLERLCTGYPDVRVLAFATRPNDTDTLRTYRTGGRGMLSRKAGVEELVRALDAIHNTGIYHTEQTHRLLLENPVGLSQEERNRKRLLEQFPAHGLEVLERICREDDLTYAYIGEELAIGKRTVEKRVNQLFELFGVRSKTALALGAVRLGIVVL